MEMLNPHCGIERDARSVVRLAVCNAGSLNILSSTVTDGVREIPYCQGYCYTQLTDVMQEINGVLTPDRRPKVDVARFAAINRGEGSSLT